MSRRSVLTPLRVHSLRHGCNPDSVCCAGKWDSLVRGSAASAAKTSWLGSAPPQMELTQSNRVGRNPGPTAYSSRSSFIEAQLCNPPWRVGLYRSRAESDRRSELQRHIDGKLIMNGMLANTSLHCKPFAAGRPVLYNRPQKLYRFATSRTLQDGLIAL